MPLLVYPISVIMVLLRAFALILASTPFSTSMAQSPPIILITSQDASPHQEILTSFRRHFEQQHHEPPLLTYSLSTESQPINERLASATPENVRLFVTIGSQATRLVLGEAGHLPVVACMGGSATELKKASNATGVTIDFSIATHIQQLQRFLPERKTIGVLYNPAENREHIQEAQKVAQTLGVQVLARPVKTPQALPKALTNLAPKVEVLWGLIDQTVLSRQMAQPLLLFSFRHRIPFIGPSSSWTEAGALYSLDRDYTDVGVQCGEIVSTVLRGTRAGSIPPEPPRKVTYSINLKTAQHMQIDFAPSVREGASEVFQ